MYRVKIFTQELIIKNPQLKSEVEDEYYKLLINIAKEKHSDFDLRKYYIKVSKLVK
jgi:hypothetical protein